MGFEDRDTTSSRSRTNDGTGGTYVYDAESRIISATNGSVTTTYVYDAFGRRISKTSGSTATNYWFGPSGDTLAETDSSGTFTNYIFFGGQRLARNIPQPSPNPADIKYYITDHLHSTAMFVDKSGTVLDDNDFYPWGGVVPGVGTTSSNNHYKFTGKERDTESGLDYFGARYYGNVTGRFMSPDWAAKPTSVPYAEFGDPQSLNLYSYVRNSPIVRVDADGHNVFSDPFGNFGEGMPTVGTEVGLIAFLPGQKKPQLQQQAPTPSIAAAAKNQVGSTEWEEAKAKGSYKAGSNKCNQGVADWIEKSGKPRPKVKYTGWRGWLGLKRDPTAHEWADPKVDIPGWTSPMLAYVAQPGDVIAQEHGDWGHVGIVVGPNETVSVNSTTDPKGIVTQNDWGFRPAPLNGEGEHDPPVVVRRYIGDDQQ